MKSEIKVQRIDELKSTDTIPDNAYIPIMTEDGIRKITYADFIAVVTEDIIELWHSTLKNTAAIDYVAMMTDVDLPTNGIGLDDFSQSLDNEEVSDDVVSEY